MLTLANGFVQRKCSVDLVLARAEDPYLKDVSPAVRIMDLKAGRVIRALFPLIWYLRRVRPVTMLSAMNHANVAAILARKLSRITTRLVVSERITISMDAAHNLNLLARMIYALVPRLYYKGLHCGGLP